MGTLFCFACTVHTVHSLMNPTTLLELSFKQENAYHANSLSLSPSFVLYLMRTERGWKIKEKKYRYYCNITLLSTPTRLHTDTQFNIFSLTHNKKCLTFQFVMLFFETLPTDIRIYTSSCNIHLWPKNSLTR